MTPAPALVNPKTMSELGLAIYREKYQREFEANHSSKFAAIDIRSGAAILGDTADEALESAAAVNPHGMFHLIRIGYRAAFRLVNPLQ